MPFILTRINVGDYDRWKPMFRNADDPGEVFVMIEFDSADGAKAGRDKLLASGVLDRFEDKTNPKVLEEAEEVSY
jgi:hypothetical protein